jgi:hypothetical protein
MNKKFFLNCINKIAISESITFKPEYTDLVYDFVKNYTEKEFYDATLHIITKERLYNKPPSISLIMSILGQIKQVLYSNVSFYDIEKKYIAENKARYYSRGDFENHKEIYAIYLQKINEAATQKNKEFLEYLKKQKQIAN